MNEWLELFKEMGIDMKNAFFTKEGWHRTKLFIFDMEAYEKQDELLKKNYCSYCDHKEEWHDSYRHICKKCWWHFDGKIYPAHDFNEQPNELIKALHQLLPSGKIEEDTYRIYISVKSISKERLDQLEKFFKFKVNTIEPNDEYLWIVVYKTTLFCRYCNSPSLTRTDKMEHEQDCWKKPKEVTFAEVEEASRFPTKVIKN